jgi:hypothetical protein
LALVGLGLALAVALQQAVDPSAMRRWPSFAACK